MNDLDSRLTRCFQASFPGIAADQVSAASTNTLASWDSIALVNLLNLVSEEFGVQVDWERAEDLQSYAAVRQWILEQTA
jgi:acyl carrier protein